MQQQYSQKQQQAQIKAQQLAGYYDTCQLPPVPFKLDIAGKVTDVNLFVTASRNVLNTAEPLTHNWKAAYYRLWILKKYIESKKL